MGRDDQDTVMSDAPGHAGPAETSSSARKSGKAPERSNEFSRSHMNTDPVEEKGIKIYPFSIEKLSENNARYWFHAIEKQLKIQFSWQAIERYDEIGAAAYGRLISENMKWYKVNLKAETIIEQGLSARTVLEMKGFANAGSKWDYLKKAFLKSTNARKALKLMRMTNWTWDSQRMNEKEAFHEIQMLADEFVDMNNSKQVSIDELVIIWYMRGLGEKYSTLKDTIMSSNETLHKDYVLSRVQDLMDMRSGESQDKGSRAREKSIKCFKCKKMGHKVANCPSKEEPSDTERSEDNDQPNRRTKKNKPAKKKGKKAKFADQKGRIAAEENDDLVDEDSNEEFAAYAREDTHSASMARHSASFAHHSGAAASEEGSRWCFDSGATTMSTGQKEIFICLDNRYRGTLGIASGYSMPIRGRGIVEFILPNGDLVRLGDVIYVPGLAENLLSLEALHLAGFETTGCKDGYEVRKKGKLVATGRRDGRTTYLESVTSRDALKTGPSITKMQQNARMAIVTHSDVDVKRALIHRRLGHPGRQRFNHCVSEMKMNELQLDKTDKLLHDKCEICVKAKQVKNQSHKQVPRASKKLARVHMDFWGPNREGFSEEKYYLSLIDDYSRFSWLYAMKDRKASSVIAVLQSWLKRVERQSGHMLLVIRTDNAREFQALVPWANELGIEIEFIEVETPSQNGVAERFNRFILEITRALLIDSLVSKRFWKYAVMTANYLRNRTTVVIGSATEEGDYNKTPYELWFGHATSLTHLRTWGCRVLYHHRADSKLDSRVHEGTFLVY